MLKLIGSHVLQLQHIQMCIKNNGNTSQKQDKQCMCTFNFQVATIIVSYPQASIVIWMLHYAHTDCSLIICLNLNALSHITSCPTFTDYNIIYLHQLNYYCFVDVHADLIVERFNMYIPSHPDQARIMI